MATRQEQRLLRSLVPFSTYVRSKNEGTRWASVYILSENASKLSLIQHVNKTNNPTKKDERSTGNLPDTAQAITTTDLALFKIDEGFSRNT